VSDASDETGKLKEEILDLIRRLEQAEIREKFLCSDKLKIQQENAKLKERNKVLEDNARNDATIRKALLLLVGVMKHDVEHLHNMGNDETLPSEQFTAAALEVLDKIHGAFQLADLPLARTAETKEAETTGVVAKIVELKQEAG